jgi:hypothetical protein
MPDSYAFKNFHRILLSRQIFEAQARGEPSLIDLSAELLIAILVLSASSSRGTARALAIASPWTSEVTRMARLTHVSIRTHQGLLSFKALVCSSPSAAETVQTLWISTNAGIYPERAIIPHILRACHNLTALACQIGALDSESWYESWPAARPPRLTLLDPMRLQRVFPGSGSLWSRLQDTSSALLRNLTHLHLARYHRQLEEYFPVAHLPNLTHLAMGSDPSWSASYSPAEYCEKIRSFARALEQLRLHLSLAEAVLVLWAFRAARKAFVPILTQWDARELIQAARECSGPGHGRARITIYCASASHRELKFWEESAAAGEDIWSLARKQMGSFSEVLGKANGA